EARTRRVARRRGQVRLVVGGGLPRAVEVVALYVPEAERPEDVGHLEAGVDLRLARGEECTQQVVLVRLLARLVELLAELLHQLGEVRLVLRADDVARVPVGARPLPVDVDAVEDARGGARSARPVSLHGAREIALDEQVDARGDEAFA